MFVDEWDVNAPRQAVYDTLVDARTYPEWWKPVYQSVEGDSRITHHHFKGRLPYTLRMRAELVDEDPPNRFEVMVDGDLRGRGTWTLTERDGKTYVRWDWIVFADKPLLRYLTPILRPAFRWNHNWAVARAQEGLEPYARARAASP